MGTWIDFYLPSGSIQILVKTSSIRLKALTDNQACQFYAAFLLKNMPIAQTPNCWQPDGRCNKT